MAPALEATRRFHLGLLDPPGQGHTLHLIRLVWHSTETCRVMFRNAPEARRGARDAHYRIMEAHRAHSQWADVWTTIRP